MKAVRAITVAGSADREAALAAELSARPDIDLVLRCVDRLETLACIRGGSLDVAVAVGPVAWFDYQCVEEAHTNGIRLLGDAADPIETEMLEVSGFEVVSPDASVPDAVAGAAADAVEATEPPVRRGGKTIAVWGSKGAPGRTTISIELAATLAAAEPLTLLADVDLYGGDVLQLLGVVDELPGLVPLTRSAARGEIRDGSWIEALRRAGRSGPLLVPGLLRAELWNEVSPFGWDQLLSVIPDAFGYAVFDVGFCLEEAPAADPSGGRNAVARSTVAEADVVVGVLRADPVGIRSFLWALEGGSELLSDDKLLVVANRVRPGEEREIRTLIKRYLGRHPVVLIPDRPDHVTRAVWRAEPLAVCEPSSPVSEEIRSLAAAVGGLVRSRGFLARLAGRSGRA